METNEPISIEFSGDLGRIVDRIRRDPDFLPPAQEDIDVIQCIVDNHLRRGEIGAVLAQYLLENPHSLDVKTAFEKLNESGNPGLYLVTFYKDMDFNSYAIFIRVNK